jgi:hypothetical protein
MQRPDGGTILTADRMACFEWLCHHVTDYGDEGVSRPDMEWDWKARRLHDFEELGLVACIGTKPSRNQDGSVANSATARAFVPKAPNDLPEAIELIANETAMRRRSATKLRLQNKHRTEIKQAMAGEKIISAEALVRMCDELEEHVVQYIHEKLPDSRLKLDILRRLNLAVQRGRSRTTRGIDQPRSKA